MENHLLPFLWIHGEDEETYRKMITAIYNANIRAFCVEARPHKNFCKEQWWHDMDIILDEAQKRGMKVWILDDKHFPTGYANGKVEEAPLELRRQGLLHKCFPVKNGRFVLNVNKNAHPPRIPSMMYFITNAFNKNTERFHDDIVIGASAIRLDKRITPVDLSDCITNGVLNWNAPEGEWEVHLIYLSRNIGAHRSYINMMDKESCRIQIDAVYEPHYAHYKDKFHTVIAGFFSDEPELGNNPMYKMYNYLGTEQDLPWSRELKAALQERLGESYASLLSLLWSNDCDSALTARVRYVYMDCVSRLVEENFSRQIGQWCREHGVEYIGHIIEDNNQHARTGTSLGHYFRGLKWQTMAGIDDVGGQVEIGCEDRVKKNFFGFDEDGEFYHYSLGKMGSSLGALNPNMNGRTMCEIFGNYGWKEGVRLEKYLLDHFMVRGVNYFVPHAFTCSKYPERDCPPHFYAQGNNPQYRHFGELMKYADRVCTMISGGYYETPAAILYHGEAEWCGKAMLMQKPARILLDNQIDFNFVPADVFAERKFYKTQISNILMVNNHKHQVLVVPYSQYITLETAEAILELVQNGGRVIFIDGYPEGLCTGETLPSEIIQKTTCVSIEQLLDELEEYKTVQLSPDNNRIRAMHYYGDKEFFYLFNEGSEKFEGRIQLPVLDQFYLYDAWNDRNIKWDGENISLEPLHSLFIIKENNQQEFYEEPVTKYAKKLSDFKQSCCRAIDYPDFEKEKNITILQSYALTDKKFSGIIRYETTIGNSVKSLLITDAYEGVEVFINGESLGIQVVPPFVFDLRKHMVKEENELAIEVATTLERENGKVKGASPTGIIGDVIVFQ